jgi:hypothetical protein
MEFDPFRLRELRRDKPGSSSSCPTTPWAHAHGYSCGIPFGDLLTWVMIEYRGALIGLGWMGMLYDLAGRIMDRFEVDDIDRPTPPLNVHRT